MKEAPRPVPAALQGLLKKLAKAGIFRDFYLAGGTGLALLFSHRRSVDLDLFSRTNRLDFDGRRELISHLKSFQNWMVIEAKDGTLHGRFGRIKVSFFWYPQLLVKPLIRKSEIPIASIEDIGLMKIGAIIGRGSRKDFVDLYEICQRVPLSRLLALGTKKFRESRDFTLQALKALVFFEDAEKEPQLLEVKSVHWDQIERFFVQEVKKIAAKILR